MAFLDDAQTLTVVGQWQGPDGEPARGYIEVQLTQPTADKLINVIYTQRKMRYDLDGNGAVEIELIKTGSAPGDPVPLTRSVGLTITEVFEDTKRNKWSTVIDTTNNDITDTFNLADAAPIEAKAMNQYVLLGAYSADLFMKADKNNPSFTGTVTGVTKAHVGLGNADNTSDASKPVSTAQQTALNLKANAANANLTGSVDMTGANFVTDATTGTKVGTATTQKFGFFNATPVAQQSATSDLGTVLSNLGLRAAGSSYPVTTAGAVSTTGLFRRGVSLISANTTIANTAPPFQVVTAAVAVALPTGTLGAGTEYVIINTTASPITVSSATFNGVVGTKTVAAGGTLRVISTGTATNWYVAGVS